MKEEVGGRKILSSLDNAGFFYYQFGLKGRGSV